MTDPTRRSQDVRRQEEERRRAQPKQPSETPVTVLSVLAALIGAGLVCWGVWLIYQPAAYICAGAMLWLGARRAARDRKETRDAAKDG